VRLANRSRFVIPAVTLVTRNIWRSAVPATKVLSTRKYFTHYLVSHLY
jgi:hypothetical protein